MTPFMRTIGKRVLSRGAQGKGGFETLVTVMSLSLVAMVAATASYSGDLEPRFPSAPAATDSEVSSPGIAVSGTGVLKKASFRSESLQLFNSTTTFANAISDTVVLTVPGCILAQFHSEVGIFGGTESAGGRSAQFRTLIGGALAEGHGPTGQVFVSPDGGDNTTIIETEGYNAWRCGLAPGTYSVVVEFAPTEPGRSMFVRGRTLVTSFKK
jgi:hypothetical protein